MGHDARRPAALVHRQSVLHLLAARRAVHERRPRFSPEPVLRTTRLGRTPRSAAAENERPVLSPVRPLAADPLAAKPTASPAADAEFIAGSMQAYPRPGGDALQPPGPLRSRNVYSTLPPLGV